MPSIGFLLRSVNTNSGGVGKAPRLGATALGTDGLEGDRQSNLKHHGGPDQTVCLYAEEDYAVLCELGVTADILPPGAFGENFTTRGVDWREVPIGQRFRAEDGVEIEISSFRIPCANLTVLAPGLPVELYREHRFGAYARTLTAGFVAGGTHFESVFTPADPVELMIAQRALFEKTEPRKRAAVIQRVLAQSALSARTRALFENRSARA